MKRLNPQTNKPFKRGDLREDGFVFWQYHQTRLRKSGFFEENWKNPVLFLETMTKHAIWNKENSSKMNLYKANYDKKNPAKKAARVSKRRAIRKQAMPSWLTKEQHAEIAEFYLMAKELENVFPWEQHVDHIVPLQHDEVRGLHVPWNLQILSKKANLEKGNRFLVF